MMNNPESQATSGSRHRKMTPPQKKITHKNHNTTQNAKSMSIADPYIKPEVNPDVHER